jgi:hypothetical protein
MPLASLSVVVAAAAMLSATIGSSRCLYSRSGGPARSDLPRSFSEIGMWEWSPAHSDS